MLQTGLKFFLALLGLLILAFGPLAGPAQAGIEAFVSLPPQKYFVEKIGGELVRVRVMVPPGADAHTYEPKPRQMAALAKTNIYFTIGVEFEKAWLGRLKSVNRQMAVIHTEAEVPRMALARRQEKHGHAEPDHHHKGLDPHIWLSPKLAMLQARAIESGLSRTDPANRAVYQANLAALLAEMAELDQELTRALAGLAGQRHILVFHPAWGYFCRDYNLEQVAIEAEGKKPTAKGLAHLIHQAEEEGAKVIFVQPQFSDRAARTVAQAIKGRVVALDPLAEDWAANLRRVAEQLKKAAF